MYVGLAVVNLVLRFLWTVTLVPENSPNLFPEDFKIYLSPFVAAAEIVRRCVLHAKTRVTCRKLTRSAAAVLTLF